MAPESPSASAPDRAAPTRTNGNHDLTEESVSRPKSFVILLLLSVLIAAPASAQRRVTGRVTDQTSGEPIPGAAIQVQGTGIGTTTADDGTFAVQVPDGGAVL